MSLTMSGIVSVSCNTIEIRTCRKMMFVSFGLWCVYVFHSLVCFTYKFSKRKNTHLSALGTCHFLRSKTSNGCRSVSQRRNHVVLYSGGLWTSFDLGDHCNWIWTLTTAVIFRIPAIDCFTAEIELKLSVLRCREIKHCRGTASCLSIVFWTS